MPDDAQMTQVERLRFYEMRRKAHHAVRLAMMKGNLTRLTQADIDCVDCKSRAMVYDHRDYTQPLKVEPVCHQCNVTRGRVVKW